MSERPESRTCVFCRIIAREAAASFVYEDEDVVAFLDYMPVNSGHALVVPRQHAKDLAELAPEDGTRLFQVAQRLAAALRLSDVRCEGVNLLLNDGAIAGQRVFHVHLHVIPRFAEDAHRLRRPPDGPVTPPEELEAVAEQIRRALQDLER
jgi:diadenosine tetraphosphate (Ap4A) HIT family hydrolase